MDPVAFQKALWNKREWNSKMDGYPNTAIWE
jgi:hypothetical protein